MPFIAYTAIPIARDTLSYIEKTVGAEEWEKSKDEMTKLAESKKIMYVLPDWTPDHISCDHVTDIETLVTLYKVADYQPHAFWITPKK